MSNGVNTDIFQEDRRKKNRENLYQSILGQKQNPEDFLYEDPDRPEMDDDRKEQLQRLSTVAALGAGIDALTDAIGVGTSDSYAPAPTGMGQLGVSTFDRLSNLDQEHRNRLEEWRGNVLDTRRTNRDRRRQVEQRNAEVDLQLAEQKYQEYLNDAEAHRKAEEIRRENTLRDQKDYRDMARRLISRGEVPAGVVLARKGGLRTSDIFDMVGLPDQGQTNGAPQQGGRDGNGREDIGYDPTMANKISEYYRLRQQLSDIDVQPNSILAKEMEWLENQTREARFNPLYRNLAPSDTTRSDTTGTGNETIRTNGSPTPARPDTTTTNGEGSETPVPADTREPTGGGSKPNGRISPDGSETARREREFGSLLEAYATARSPSLQDELMVTLEGKLRDMGYKQKAIDRQLQALANQFDNSGSAGENDSSVRYEQLDSAGKEIVRQNTDLVQQIRGTDDRVKQRGIARQLLENWQELGYTTAEMHNRLSQITGRRSRRQPDQDTGGNGADDDDDISFRDRPDPDYSSLMPSANENKEPETSEESVSYDEYMEDTSTRKILDVLKNPQETLEEASQRMKESQTHPSELRKFSNTLRQYGKDLIDFITGSHSEDPTRQDAYEQLVVGEDSLANALEAENERLVSQFRQTENKDAREILYKKLWKNWGRLGLNQAEQIKRTNRLHEPTNDTTSMGSSELDSILTSGLTEGMEPLPLLNDALKLEILNSGDRSKKPWVVRQLLMNWRSQGLGRQEMKKRLDKLAQAEPGLDPKQFGIYNEQLKWRNMISDVWQDFEPNIDALSSGKGQALSIAQHNRSLVEQLKQTSDVEQQRLLVRQLIQNWQTLGFTREEIEENVVRLTNIVNDYYTPEN